MLTFSWPTKMAAIKEMALTWHADCIDPFNVQNEHHRHASSPLVRIMIACHQFQDSRTSTKHTLKKFNSYVIKAFVAPKISDLHFE